VADIRNAVEGDTYEGRRLLFKRGIEVGQVFKLGTKYSAKLGAKFLDEDGKQKECLMGCYGIGINRIIASAIEIGHDDNGMILPITIAPWEVIVTPAGLEDEVMAAAEKIYKELLAEPASRCSSTTATLAAASSSRTPTCSASRSVSPSAKRRSPKARSSSSSAPTPTGQPCRSKPPPNKRPRHESVTGDMKAKLFLTR
jgi:hypothetical protein